VKVPGRWEIKEIFKGVIFERNKEGKEGKTLQ